MYVWFFGPLDLYYKKSQKYALAKMKNIACVLVTYVLFIVYTSGKVYEKRFSRPLTPQMGVVVMFIPEKQSGLFLRFQETHP